MISRKSIKQHKKALSLLMFCFVAVWLPFLVTAQSSPVTSQPQESKPVQLCGYTLQPSPALFQPGPILNFAFSIDRDDKSPFSSLKQENIEALHDGVKLSINPGALQNKTSAPADVMILVDVSKSMRRQEFRKLDAVKDALHGFIRGPKFGNKDRIAIAEFDSSLRIIQPPTSDLDSIDNAVDRFTGQNGTMLYEAISKSLDIANRDGVKNLVVLSDGVDSSSKAAHYRSTNQQDELLALEDSYERGIIEKAGKYGIRIFAVEMGNTSESYPSMYVYRDSPGNISRAAGGGEDHYIDLLELRQHSDYYERLADQLGGVMEQIRSAYKYDYLLPLSLAGRAQPDGKPHTFTINFKFDRCILPVEIKYIWNPGEIAPRELTTIIGSPVFIESGSTFGGSYKDLPELTIIYLVMMVALGLLSGVPLIGQRLAEQRGTREIRRSIIKIGRGSPYINKECPSERSFRPFREGDSLLICPSCKLPHHLDCWYQAQGRCYKRNCALSNTPLPLPETLIKSYKLPPVS